MKRILPMILALLCIPSNTFAALKPQNILRGEDGGLKTVEKVYVLPVDESDEPIPTEKFTEDGIQYGFVRLEREDNFRDDSVEHSETASIKIKTNDTQAAIAALGPTKEVTTEDGYSGTLEADFSTLNIKSAGTGSQSYDVKERRTYSDLDSADTSAVPKTIEKDGLTLELTDIEWTSAASDSIDGQELAVRFTANAEYTGTGTRTYSKGYIASVEYKGTVTKTVQDSVTYTAVFIEVEQPAKEDKNADKTEKGQINPLICLLFIPAALMLCVVGCMVAKKIRSKREE